MIQAQPQDKTVVIDLLTQSFEDNKSVNYIIRQDKKRKARIRALMAYSFEVCQKFGEVWLSSDHHACALIVYPDRKKATIWLDIKLILHAIGIAGISKVLKREAEIKNKQPKTPMVYLWFIGVAPIHQHQGTGSQLLQEVIAHARRKNRPVFLETSVLKNLSWYERFDFHVYDVLESGYTLYFLNNSPV